MWQLREIHVITLKNPTTQFNTIGKGREIHERTLPILQLWQIYVTTLTNPTIQFNISKGRLHERGIFARQGHISQVWNRSDLVTESLTFSNTRLLGWLFKSNTFCYITGAQTAYYRSTGSQSHPSFSWLLFWPAGFITSLPLKIHWYIFRCASIS